MRSMAYWLGIVAGIVMVGTALCEEVSREKRDDAHKFIVTTILEKPYVMLKNERGTGNDNFEGLIPDMMSYISDKLKIDYEFKQVEDGKYGSQDNGNWNGMIGEILNKKADMAAAPMTISEERKKVLDFTEPYENFGTVILMQEPQKGEEITIHNLDDLAAQHEVSYGIVRDGVTQTFFKSSNIDTYKKIWENISKNPQNLVSNVGEAVEKVRNSGGKYAFIVETATAEYWVNIPPCDLMTVGDRINTNSFAFALKKNDDYKEKLDEVIKEMKTNGKMNELRRKWKKGHCGRDIYEDETSNAPSVMFGITRHVVNLALTTYVFIHL